MFSELKEYSKYYRTSFKKVSTELKHNKSLITYLVSSNTDFCQYMNAYYFGLINLYHPKKDINYYQVYCLDSVLNNIIQNKVFTNPFNNQINAQPIDIYPFLNEQLINIINILNLDGFVAQTNDVFNLIADAINQTQQKTFAYDKLINNIVTWTIYLLINDKLKNSEIDNIEIVDLWIEKLTILTSLLTEQLKEMIGPNFGLILEYIANIVLSI